MLEKRGMRVGCRKGHDIQFFQIIDIVVFPIDLCDNVRPQRARKLNPRYMVRVGYKY